MDKIAKLLKEYEELTKTLDRMVFENPNWLKVYDKHKKKRVEFVIFCRKQKMSFEEIGDILEISKQRVWQIDRYGYRDWTNKKAPLNKKIRSRDKNKCVICSSKKNLCTHHVFNPRHNALYNLITLCGGCHKKVHSKGNEELKDKVKRLAKNNLKSPR